MFPIVKDLVKSNTQDITVMKCTTTHKKVREIGGALGKNDIFSHYFPTLSPIPPQNLGMHSLPYEVFVLDLARPGQPTDKNNCQVCYKIKIL